MKNVYITMMHCGDLFGRNCYYKINMEQIISIIERTKYFNKRLIVPRHSYDSDREWIKAYPLRQYNAMKTIRFHTDRNRYKNAEICLNNSDVLLYSTGVLCIRLNCVSAETIYRNRSHLTASGCSHGAARGNRYGESGTNPERIRNEAETLPPPLKVPLFPIHDIQKNHRIRNPSLRPSIYRPIDIPASIQKRKRFKPTTRDGKTSIRNTCY